MIKNIRSTFNKNFSEEAYQNVIKDIQDKYKMDITFRIGETPVFIDKELKAKLFRACEEITDVIVKEDFKEKSQNAVLAGQIVPNETPHTTFLQMDFGLCDDGKGSIIPQLIEVQGFPSLYFFQYELEKHFRKYYSIPEKFSAFNNHTDESYIEDLRNIIVGDSNPENVILLEVEPLKQNTAIDFAICKELIGVPYVCVSELIVEGKKVYYKNEEGRKIKVEKIFNRVIFDELVQRDDLKRQFYFTKEEYDVEWIGHPHWFFRISKHTLPYLKSEFVPHSYFLNELEELPEDLKNYVLKPLYSFAGSGVLLNLNRHDIGMIKDPENYILQKKVKYASVIDTPDIPAKCEVRMLMLWERGAARPRIVSNICRLSKGAMIGVKYNKDKIWVGGTVGFFE